MVYLKGFYEGKMTVGDHAGKSVQDAKPLIRTQLISGGQAVVYQEPEKTVVSRHYSDQLSFLNHEERTRFCIEELKFHDWLVDLYANKHLI